VAREVHEIGGVIAIMDGEGRVKPDLDGMFEQEARTNAMKGAGPGESIPGTTGIGAEDARQNPFDSAGHLAGTPTRKGEEEDTPGIGAIDDEMGDPMGQGIGFARAGARNHQQRRGAVSPDAMLHRAALLGVQGL